MINREKNMPKDLDEILGSVPDCTNAQLFCNTKYVGIDVGWSRKGKGWGHITLSCRLSDGTWHLDDECMKKETVIKILCEAIPDLVEQLYEKGQIKPDYKEEDSISLTITMPKES
jgi:hypothetical protein